ncbi:hypothetical protein EVAR_65096_1 [Eumeta japonica]|uniref:Uncharacterized protein n=1 Tax=Eumeta variegata TaxID=151549 RepID=A0A4C1Z0P6_EUMVA|nr:hypothetical protein EVAR_65096_1 [Eumeta japonica]
MRRGGGARRAAGGSHATEFVTTNKQHWRRTRQRRAASTSPGAVTSSPAPAPAPAYPRAPTFSALGARGENALRSVPVSECPGSMWAKLMPLLVTVALGGGVLSVTTKELLECARYDEPKTHQD